MGWWWQAKSERRSSTRIAKDNEHDLKLQQGHEALLNAATTTADIAHDITTILKGKLDDSVRQIEITAKLLHDALIVCDAHGKISSFNCSAEQIFGWKAHEIIGLPLDTLFRNSNGARLNTNEIMDLLEAETNFDSETCFSDEPIQKLRGKRKTGDIFWIDGNISKFERLDGSLLSIIVIKDMSKIMNIQQLLYENETRYRSVFEQSFDGIVIVDNFHIVACNPAMADMVHCSNEEMLAKPFSIFVHEDFLNLVNSLHSSRIKGDSDPHNYLLKLVRHDGSIVDTLVSSTLMKWNGKNASLITIKDLTNINP